MFALPELVEQILLHLPTKDLLLSKRVCKTFRNVHDDYISIKKALFLVPGTANDTCIDAGFPTPLSRFSLAKLEKMWFEEHCEVPLPKTLTSREVAFNPLLVRKVSGQNLLFVPGDQESLQNSFRMHARLAQASDEASCQSMYFAQPPVHVCTVILRLGVRFEFGASTATISPKRVSELVKEMKDVVDRSMGKKKWAVEWVFGLKGRKQKIEPLAT